MKFNKKSQVPGMGLFITLFAIVGVVFAVFWVASLMGGKGSGLTVTPSVDGVTATDVLGKITLTEDTTVTFSAVDKFDSSIGINGNHQYIVNGGAAKTVANLGTDTLSPGDSLMVLFGQGNNSGTVVYLNSLKTFTVPDKGTYNPKGELYRNGTLTSRIFNEEGNLVDDTNENETLAAGDVVTLNVELQGQYERGQFANGGCAIVEYNTTAYDDVIYDVGGSKIGTPDYYTVSATAMTTKTYTIPAFTSNAKLTGSLMVDVDDVVDPVSFAAGTSSGTHIRLNFVPNEYRLNSNTNQFELFACGEDQDGNRVSNPIDSQLDILQVD